jgi:hypothetical protein
MTDPDITSLWINYRELERRIRLLEDLVDVNDSPLWKRILFVVDGWPLRRVVDKPRWRPWRRWWTS